MKHTYHIQGMTCNGCRTHVEEILSKIEGVRNASVDLEQAEAIIEMEHHIDIKTLQKSLPDKYSISEKPMVTMAETSKETKSKLEQLRPLFLILGYITVASILLNYNRPNWEGVMLDFMGLFYIVFSFFKMLDLKGFPNSFRMYDPLAKAVPFYAWVYPFIETILGILFLMRLYVPFALIATLVVLGITMFGVTKTLLDKKSIQCACLGTALKLPMTEATFIENAIMIVMAISILMGL